MRKVLMGCLMLLTISAASAQQFRLKFTTKMPFSVGNANLPAGTYTVRVSEDDSGTFEISAPSGTPSALFDASPMEVTPTETGVAFMKYGDKMLLKNMTIAGEQGYWLDTALQEKHHKKSGAKPTKVTAPAAKS